MPSEPFLFPKIKALVHEIVPDAEVLLFGSQANGTATEESDWDVLVLTQQPVDRALKEKLHNHLFPLSIKEGAVISPLLVQEDNWNINPSYYALQQTIAAGRIIS